MEYQSLASIVITNPIFAGVVALAIVMAGSMYLRHRNDSAFWRTVGLLKDDQYRDATPTEISSLIAFARQRGKDQLVLTELAEIRRLHATGVKHGHMWFIVWRMRGVLPPHARPPACTREAGGLELFQDVPVDATRKGW